MKPARLTFIAFTFFLLPSALTAQGLAIGARAGTLGLGGEVAFGFSDTFVIRGGFGAFPFEYDGTFDELTPVANGADLEEQKYTITFPSLFWSAGVDLYLGGGPIRLMGGIMGRTDDLEVSSEIEQSVEIGDTEYNAPGTLKGILDQSTIAPFAGIGFGKHTEEGFGFFLDIGAAFAGEADVKLTVDGPLALEPGIQEDLQILEDDVEEDAGGYLKIWPIVSLGIKLPLNFGY